MTTEQGDTRLIDLTLAELMAVLRTELARPEESPKEQLPPQSRERWIIHGMPELAKLVGCSRSQAYRIAKEVLPPDAVYRYGQTVAFDAEKVLEALQTRRKRKGPTSSL